MKFLLKQDKKGISNMVAYALLISITISLSIIVYGWLRFYAGAEGVTECPSDVSLVIENYTCVSGDGNNLVVNLKNKGLFTIDGYSLRVHDESNREFGIYLIADKETPIEPGATDKVTYIFDSTGGIKITKVSLIEVQPFLLEDEKIACRSVVVQKNIVCS